MIETSPRTDFATCVEPKLRTLSEVEDLKESIYSVRLLAADPLTNHISFEERQQLLCETLGKIDVLRQFTRGRFQTEEKIEEGIRKTYEEIERVENELGKTWEQVQQEFEKVGYLGYIGPQDGVKAALNSRKTYLLSSLDAYNWLLGEELEVIYTSTSVERKSQVAA